MLLEIALESSVESYAMYYFLLNPLYNLLPYHGRKGGMTALFFYGTLKLIVV
jgi:hypothetical protein